jgi:hypothetical protein
MLVISGEDFAAAAKQGSATAAITDNVTSLHVHNAARGQNGSVVFGQINPAHDTDDLSIVQNANGSWTIKGVWETTDPAAVSINQFAAALTAAKPGEDVPLYFNSHTTAFPGGEIRGQWEAVAQADAYFLI